MKKVLDFVQRFDLLPRYELLLAAASGGLDSMCLLDFLYENGYRVCAAHYNHQLRGQEADMDEDLVRAWCAARRIPLCVGTAFLGRKQVIYRCQLYFFRAAFQVSTPPSSDFDTLLPPCRRGHGQKCSCPRR